MQKHDPWIRKATSDLRLAKKGMEDSELWEVAIYHTQQCAEKALKGYLVKHEEKILKTHDLTILLEFCVDKDKNFKSLLFSTALLNPYSTAFHYPDDRSPGPEAGVLKEAIEHASKILTFVQDKIKEIESGQINIFFEEK